MNKLTDVMPIKCPKEDMETLGFVFGEKADELFYNVRFPDGWTRKATDHDLWTSVLDSKGRERASIGYKVAFYDRWPSCQLAKRYSYMSKNEQTGLCLGSGETGYVCVYDFDGTELYKTNTFLYSYTTNENKDANQECINWLNDNYPDWQNATAYWD